MCARAGRRATDHHQSITVVITLTNTPPLPPPTHPTTQLPPSDPLAAFRMPIVDKYRDMGTMVMGKSEAGLVRVGDVLQLMPNRVRV